MEKVYIFPEASEGQSMFTGLGAEPTEFDFWSENGIPSGEAPVFRHFDILPIPRPDGFRSPSAITGEPSDVSYESFYEKVCEMWLNVKQKG
jgi:hypothetical protein